MAGKAPSRDLSLSNSLKNEEFLVTDHGDFSLLQCRKLSSRPRSRNVASVLSDREIIISEKRGRGEVTGLGVLATGGKACLGRFVYKELQFGLPRALFSQICAGVLITENIGSILSYYGHNVL